MYYASDVDAYYFCYKIFPTVWILIVHDNNIIKVAAFVFIFYKKLQLSQFKIFIYILYRQLRKNILYFIYKAKNFFTFSIVVIIPDIYNLLNVII